MLGISLISKINHERRPKEKVHYDPRSKKLYSVFTDHMLCTVGEKLGILSKIYYSYKEGYFYHVINKNDETFKLYEDEIKVNFDVKPKLLFENRIPRYIDCIEPEIFSLDLL